MSRTAEDILEFVRLRELLRRQTTCAPGRRAIDALSFSTDRAALDAVFALIAEAIAYRHDGSEMGFGSVATRNRGLRNSNHRLPSSRPPCFSPWHLWRTRLRHCARPSAPVPAPAPERVSATLQKNFLFSPRARALSPIYARSPQPFAEPSCRTARSATMPLPS